MTDLFARLGELLTAFAAARDRLHRAAVDGDADAANRAELDHEESLTDVYRFETDVALAWILGLRLALKHYPHKVAVFFDELDRLRADWEDQARRHAKRRG